MRLRKAPLAALAAGFLLAAAVPAAAENKHQDTTTYTEFDALTATILRPDGRRGVLTVQGGLDVKDAGLRARTAVCKPILRDAYVRMLNLYAQSLPPGSAPDVDQIGTLLQRATDGVLRRPDARVLLGTVMVN